MEGSDSHSIQKTTFGDVVVSRKFQKLTKNWSLHLCSDGQDSYYVEGVTILETDVPLLAERLGTLTHENWYHISKSGSADEQETTNESDSDISDSSSATAPNEQETIDEGAQNIPASSSAVVPSEQKIIDKGDRDIRASNSDDHCSLESFQTECGHHMNLLETKENRFDIPFEDFKTNYQDKLWRHHRIPISEQTYEKAKEIVDIRLASSREDIFRLSNKYFSSRGYGREGGNSNIEIKDDETIAQCELWLTDPSEKHLAFWAKHGINKDNAQIDKVDTSKFCLT
ncbi:uncharacterized protein I206_103089 [Kwoniella pini CBS 10737]|uniref:Uncharacterized protein n=1 Tax=Kwoniella pini CBS 10737 TaxID=1296096 RepID=A0A1B9IAZ9_9TREE|nr:uncharacterized protein I206_01907 [Kwoniella pini CBS 10737]OCF52614.1 hypothetical protein I206_01907 [Kwoniella pini CBS 10737]